MLSTQQAHALYKEGFAKKEIARAMNLDIHTVRTYLMAETFPERALRCAAHLARQRNSPANGPLTAFKGRYGAFHLNCGRSRIRAFF